ncbi:MAG: transglutaminase family protein [Phycisphaerae bacterium]|nr:transglutaminase family protein [Phycisphaerae bacterium]
MNRATPERDLDPGSCLGSTRFIDSEHPRIQETIRRLELKALSPRERARRLFTFVRDDIAYEFAIRFTPEQYVASYVLQDGKGFCVRKAVLLCALGRAAEIPTALVLSDLRDFTLSTDVKAALHTDVMYHHGLSALHVNGTWLLADASLTPELNRRKGYRLVEFDGARDALLPDTTLNGSPHVQYVAFHGLYADLPYDQMMQAFQRGYANADRSKIPKLGLPPPN